MEPTGQKNSHDTQGSIREVVGREPLLLGPMFPRSLATSLIPIETSIAWSYLEELAVLADRNGLEYIFMGNGYYVKGGDRGIGGVQSREARWNSLRRNFNGMVPVQVTIA